MIRGLRLALAAVAVVAVSWFTVGVRQAHEVDAATTLLNQDVGHNAAKGRRIGSLLSSAAFLNPGVDVVLLRAQLDMAERNFAGAKVLVDRAVAAEPGNLNVWISALHLAIDHPSAENAQQIVRHLRRLDPVDARSFSR
jgi:hypothetical protein